MSQKTKAEMVALIVDNNIRISCGTCLFSGSCEDYHCSPDDIGWNISKEEAEKLLKLLGLAQ